MESFLSEEFGRMRGDAWIAEARPSCSYYRADGICSFGCWEEPICHTSEPEDGWLREAFERWIDTAETARAAAVESRGDHRAVKELRDLARNAHRNAVRVLALAESEES